VRSPLALTIGDPAGIGPEVVLKALADPDITRTCAATVFGSRSLLSQTRDRLCQLGQPVPDLDTVNIVDITTPGDIVLGEGNAASGGASFAYLQAAIAATLKGEFGAIVTGPIAKSAWKAAGHHYPGQTEVLANAAGVDRFGMLFVARSPHTGWTLRTLLATTHIPLSCVAETLNPELLSWKLELFVNYLQRDCGIAKPKIAIAGLNPHSGEGGQLGTEERDWIGPWLHGERDRFRDLQIDGPVPPDTLWVKPGQAWFGNNAIEAADGYLALYHDQGLIPVKLMGFDRAVNTTIGLPFIRTSPDHGTAFDIVGKGVADATSMKAALLLASQSLRSN